jgi:hypothetical protein
MDVQKPINSIGKSIGKSINTVRSVVSTVGDTLNNMRPKKRYGKTAFFDKPVKCTSCGGGKKGGNKTKRNMRKRGTQKRR